MKQAVNILMLGGARRVSMARHIIKAGARHDLNVNLFSYELTDEVPIAEVATVIKGARWSDNNLMEHLHDTIKDNGIDILLPFVDPSVEVALRYVHNDSSVWTPGSNINMVAIMFNKIAADETFRKFAIPIPPNPKHETVVGEIIAKPCFGSASKGIRILTADEYYHLAKTDKGNDFLFQKYFDKRKEYTVDCYVDHTGKVVCAIPRIRLDIAGGEVTDTVTVRDIEIEQLSIEILNRLQLTGPITLQFLRELYPSGHLGPAMLMEINPRFGGGAVCAIHAGADIPYFMFGDYLGKPMQPCDIWLEGTRICRYQQEVVFYT